MRLLRSSIADIGTGGGSSSASFSFTCACFFPPCPYTISYVHISLAELKEKSHLFYISLCCSWPFTPVLPTQIPNTEQQAAKAAGKPRNALCVHVKCFLFLLSLSSLSPLPCSPTADEATLNIYIPALIPTHTSWISIFKTKPNIKQGLFRFSSCAWSVFFFLSSLPSSLAFCCAALPLCLCARLRWSNSGLRAGLVGIRNPKA